MRSRFLVLLLVGSIVSTGCVEYVPVELGAVPPDEEVRVRVREETAVRVGRYLGQIREELTASVEPRGADSLAIIVWIGKDYPGTPFEDVRETVIVGRDEVRELRRRQLSVWRTAAASAGAVVAVAVLADQITQRENRNPSPDPGDERPPPFRFPLFRISGGWIP